MAGLFDFEKFYADKTVKTEIHLDLSGIDLKSTASSESENDDGTADNVGMNEYITNNVMYKISGIGVNGGSSLIDVDASVVIKYHMPNGPFNQELVISECCPVDVLVSANMVQIPETSSPMDPVTFVSGSAAYDSDDNQDSVAIIDDLAVSLDGVLTPVADVTVAFVPRVRLQNTANLSKAVSKPYSGALMMDAVDPSFYDTNQNPWEMRFGEMWVNRALGGLGFYGSRYLGWKWYEKRATQSQTLKRNMVIGYDTFRRRLDEMSKILEQNNMGLKVTYYDDSLAETMRDSEGNVTGVDDWTYDPDFGRGERWRDYYGRMDAFVGKCVARGDDNPLPDLKGTETVTTEDTTNTIQNATALIPNVADAFKKYFYHADELADEFNDKYFDTYRSIKSIKGVRKFMSSSLKRKLDNELVRLKKPVDTTVAPEFLLDVASCANLLNYFFDKGSLFHPADNSGNRDYTNGVRMVSDWGWEVKFNSGYKPDANGTYTYFVGTYASASFTSNQTLLPGLFYETCRNNALGNLYFDWRITSSEMTVADIKAMLCDYFTGMFNGNTDEGEEGYVRWYYDSTQATEAERYRLTVTYDNGSGLTSADLYTLDYQPGNGTRIVPVSDIEQSAKQGDIAIIYSGTARAYIDIVMREISALLNSSDIVGSSGYYYFNTLTDDYKIKTAQWDTCSTAKDVISFLDFRPSYDTYDNVGDIPNSDIDGCISFATDVMGDAIDEIDTILNVQGIFLGAAYLLIQKMNLREAKENYEDLMSTINKIRWYQAYTGESVFENRSYVGDRSDVVCPYIYMPARFLIPVLMYKKVRVKYKRFFRTRYKMVKRSIGVRWVEVTFVDNDVYESYPQNSNEPQQFYQINKYATVHDGALVFDADLEGTETDQLAPKTITKFQSAEFVLLNADGVRVTVAVTSSSREFAITDGTLAEGSNVFVYGVYLPLDPTNKSDDLTPIRIEYKMPHLPYDSEIRRWAFESYGAFDQSKYASISREVPAEDDKKDGWRIFRPSSKRIGDLRAQLGIYDAASILVGILRNAYGAQQVEIVDTMRSIDDQALMCTGSAESTFLSWHNYGLAVKILINDPITGMAIEDGSDDMKKLIDIAEGFTIACANGAFGKPLNVVWCGRLKMGANIFDWEFLPVGVEHKDAPKFRDAMFNQEDPVMSLGFVDVDAAGFVYDKPPTAKVPYVLRKGTAYTNAKVINGHRYVSPSNIRNYKVPNDLVLQNILEFVNLVNAKQGANGTDKTDRASMTEWKTLNDKSFKQLIMYYGMIGSISAAKALVAGEYVEKYRNIVDAKFSENYVAMVQDYLGSLYDDAKIYIESVGDGGAWLSVKDGKIHIKTTDLVPDYNPNSKGHFFNEKQANVQNMKRGMWVKGVFYTEDQLVEMGYPIETVSEESFIEGFDNEGNVERGDALLIHSLMATQIKNEFDKIRDLFENFGGNLMYDHFKDGSNASMENMLENEFGLIAGQDLLDFDKLRNIYRQKDINDNAAKSTTDGTIRGAGANEEDGDESVYEKVVSNAQLAGIRKASLTKEHVQVNARANALTTEQLYKLITKGKMRSANDLLSR